MKLILLSLAVLSGMAAAASAESRKIKFRTLCFFHNNNVKEMNLITSGGAKISVPLFTSDFSDEIEADISGNDLLFGMDDMGPDGKPRIKTLASGKAADAPHQIIVFVPASASTGLAYQILAFDDSEEAFPMGSTLTFNFAATPVKFVVGEHRKEILPGAKAVIPQALMRNATNQCPVEISFAQPDKSWRAVSSTRWISTTERRSLAISFVHPVSGKSMVNCYQDLPPWRLPKL